VIATPIKDWIGWQGAVRIHEKLSVGVARDRPLLTLV
jgi:hypothetical protein